MKKWIIGAILIILAGVVIGYIFVMSNNKNIALNNNANNLIEDNVIINQSIENIANAIAQKNNTTNTAMNTIANNSTTKQPPITSTKPQSKATKAIINYGISGEGRKLIATKITNDKTGKKKVILLNFAIHGFEDHHTKDAKILVSLADKLTTYLMNNPDLLNSWVVYIIRCANPDGLNDGTTNNGPGRCQTSLGIDLNRDFPYNFKTFSDKRNKTLKKALSAPESKGLYDFTLSIKPTVVLDIHGWEDNTLGSSKITKYFTNKLSLGANKSLSKATGYFAAWATTVVQDAALIELPMPTSNSNSTYVSKYYSKFNSAVEELLKNY